MMLINMEKSLRSKGNTMFYQVYVQWKYRITNKLTSNVGIHGSLLALNDTKVLNQGFAQLPVR